ncbi:MAG: DNA internalization-related competence protein ComEC/Rec2 [Desulfobulbaceae bacterium]|nr:DNA internalization-related competence protein ComEC/Rec2 [Pseudomonadota bacterium]MCG2748640.1 DNA internalization-related competence protein ComEC/Rec2 [Desulfobulbaceae bacterium]
MLIQVVIAFTGGIAWAAFIAPKPFFLFPAFFLLALAVFLSWFRKNTLQLPLLFLFWFVCGLLQGASLQPPSERDSLYQLFATDREVTLAGTLLQAPAVSADKTRLLMQADAYLPPQNSSRSIEQQPVDSADLSVPNFIRAQGKIELALRGPPPEKIQPGQKLLVRAYVSRPKALSNPGGFDYRKYLAAKSIRVNGWISSPAHIAISPADNDQSWLHRLRFVPEQLRHHINQFLTVHLAPGQSSLYKAILTGDRSSLSPQTLENFKSTGAMHLLAISGLHMGLIALGFGAVINWLLKRSTWLLIHTSAWKTAVYFIMSILCGYALIAGLQTPVLRSLIMASVFLLAVLFDRQWHIPTNIAIAVLIILLINPAALFTVSFQLSFAAAIAMAAIMPKFAPLPQQADTTEQVPRHLIFARIGTSVKMGFLLSLAALAGTLPLLIFYFNRFSPLSTISTLLLEPLLCFWALPLGLISAPFIFFAPQVAHVLLTMGAMGLTMADRLCAWLAALPYSSIWLPTPLPLEVICYYGLLFSILSLKKSKIARLTAIISIVTLLITAGYTSYRQHANETDTVTVLDVGQGNAIVIELAGGFTALIDGGGSYSPQFNVGERVIAPFLWSRRVSHLDAVIISHPDADHFNGLAFIIKRFRPQTLWVNGDNAANNSYTALLDLAAQQGADIHVPQSGETLFNNSQSRFYNVADIHQDGANGSDNDRSLVIGLSSHGKNFLFTGDIEVYAEQKMTEGQKELHADVLLLPHHGSNSSTSTKFLSAVAPEYAVISAGRNQSQLFPAPEVIKRCRSAGCTIYNTALDGAVIFRVTEGGALSVSTTLATHR